MKILYVATLVNGFEDILEGKTDSRGLPGFILPLKKLLEGGNQIDIILISSFPKTCNISVGWIKNENIISIIHNDLTSLNMAVKNFNKIKSFLHLWNEVDKSLRHGHYDFVYCHGKAAIIGNMVANLRKVPCAYRVYGTAHLYESLNRHGRLYTIIHNPVYYLMFKLKKCFMLGTDDGSGSDYVYNLMKPRKNPYPFHYWVNGIDIETIESLDNAGPVPKGPYLFIAGRIDPIKNQLHVINMLRKLHDDDIKIHLYMAGHVTDFHYNEDVKTAIEELELQDYVHFLGVLPRELMKKTAYYAKATVIWDDFSQNGCTFYDVFSTGATIVSKDDGSLNRFITMNQNAFVAKTVDEAVLCLKKVIALTPEERSNIQNSAVKQASSTLESWLARISRELELIESVVNKPCN